MRRRRYYGKPPPSKEQVQAHYDFYAQVNEVVKQEDVKMKRLPLNVPMNVAQQRIIKRMICAELNAYQQRQNHAASHGMDYQEPESVALTNLLRNLEAAQIKDEIMRPKRNAKS